MVVLTQQNIRLQRAVIRSDLLFLPIFASNEALTLTLMRTCVVRGEVFPDNATFIKDTPTLYHTNDASHH